MQFLLTTSTMQYTPGPLRRVLTAGTDYCILHCRVSRSWRGGETEVKEGAARRVVRRRRGAGRAGRAIFLVITRVGLRLQCLAKCCLFESPAIKQARAGVGSGVQTSQSETCRCESLLSCFMIMFRALYSYSHEQCII